MLPDRKPWTHFNVPGIYCLLEFLFASSFLSAQTQVYPVSVITQLVPPYSVNLADYVAPGTDQLRVIIVQRDLTQAPYRMYLRMEIQLNGRTIIRTSPEYFPPALTLDPGVPTVISGSDLSSFFDPWNMEFTGYSREAYARTKLLPEGAYVITFTAYDFTRQDVVLSHGGSFFCYLAKSEPPLLNLPLNNSLLIFSSPQYINFQWLPRTVASPNSTASTKYKLELFEMRIGGMSPNEIVNSARPVFTTETERTNYLYSIADPLLEKGLKYVWRIKAFDTSGKDYIRNNGYSEVFSFIYGEAGQYAADALIENFEAQAVTSRKARLTWDISPAFDNYKIFYRKQGTANRWYESENNTGTAEISGLSPGLIYECRVQGRSSGIWGSMSETDTALMPVPRTIECGSAFIQPAISNRNPLLELMRLQEFDAEGFMVTLTDPMAITTKPGIFSGKGYVQVPLFGHKKIRCVFNNVFINSDYQMVEGVVNLLTDNTRGGDNALWNIDEVFEGGTENGSVIQGTEGAAVEIPDIIITKPERIILDTTRGEIIVITGVSDTTRINVGEKLDENPATLTLKDSEGNLYSVDTETGKSTFLGQAAKKGNVQQAVNLPQIIDERKGIVKFGPAEDTRFAFDKKDSKYRKSNLFNDEYETIKLYDGSEYDVPVKLIPAGETDKVLAIIEKKGKSVSEDSIVFRSGTGTVFKAQPSGKKLQYVLTLPSGKDNDGIEVYATYTSKGQTFVLGKMTVISYRVKKPRLVLVPVNGNDAGIDIGSVKRELDNVYHPVAVDWQVSIDRSDFRYSSDSLNIAGSGLWSRYTDGMKSLNTEFVMHKKEEFDASAIYLFLLKSSDDPQATGDMPRNVQFGYVFTEKSGNDRALFRTIAHEIAHGMFHLSHTFDNNYQIERGTTDNLLDYTAGTALVKHQWDAIHDPGLVLGMFERDEEGMMKIFPCVHKKPSIVNNQEGQLFISNGTKSVPNGYGGNSVPCEERYYYHIEEKPYNSCCDEIGKEVIVQSEFKSDWYTEEEYSLKVIRATLESFGILDEKIKVLPTNSESRRIAASYNIEQFFEEREISDDLLKIFETSYYSEVCREATKKFSGSGTIERVNVELDIALILSPVKGIKSLFNYFKTRLSANATKLFTANSENGIAIFSSKGGEEIANLSNGVLKNIKYIDEGGEVLSKAGDIKILENGKQLDVALDLVKKDGQIGFRKAGKIISDIELITTKIVKGPKTKIKLASDVNKTFPPYQNPYKPGTTVEEFELYDDAVFIRVYDDIKSAKDGSWVMSIEDFKKANFNARELENSYALPQKPLKYAKVTVPKGSKMSCGITNSQNFRGQMLDGGTTQYQILTNYKTTPGFKFEEIGLLK